MRKKLLHLLLFSIISLGLFLSSCQEKEHKTQSLNKSGSESFHQTPINWIGIWSNRESKKNLVSSATREYEIKHQNIKVNIKYQEELCGGCKDPRPVIQDTIIHMIKTGNYNWDIIPLTQKYYKEIARILDDPDWSKKYLVNFEDFDWFKERHIGKIFKVAQYKDDFGGIFAGPLIEGRNYGLWYNAELAKKLGLSIKATGMTFDDFLGYCKVVNEYNQNSEEQITFLPDRKISPQAEIIFNQLVLSELSLTENQLPDKSEALLAIRKGLNALEELCQYNAVNPKLHVDKNFLYNLNEQVLFSVKPSSWYNQCESADKNKAKNLIPVEAPVFYKSAQYYPGSYQSVWAVFKNATHRNQAIDLLKYISSNDVAERWLSTTYNPTGLKVKLKATDFGANDIEKFNNYIEQKYGDNLKNFDLEDLLFGKEMKLEPYKVLMGINSAEEYYSKYIINKYNL